MLNALKPATPLVFVLLWSTGFIFGRLSMEIASPAAFLSLRFALAALVLIALILLVPALRQFRFRNIDLVHAAIAGILLQAIYLGGVFAGINLGVGAGLSSLIVGIQPVLTVLLARLWLSESLGLAKLIGICLGFIGVALVTAEWGHIDGAITTDGILFCVFALLGITFGTLYQKRFCQSMNLQLNMATQYVASALFLLPFALQFETFNFNWDGQLVFSMIWLVLVLSIGAVFLLMWLIKVGEAGRVSTLFFLVPPVVAIEAWILFDEPLTPLVVIGTALTITGVALVTGKLDGIKQFSRFRSQQG